MSSTLVRKIEVENSFFKKCGQFEAYGDIFERCYVHQDWTLKEVKKYCLEKIRLLDDDMCKLDDELQRLRLDEESGD